VPWMVIACGWGKKKRMKERRIQVEYGVVRGKVG
jgi:hypothetical protein